MRGHPEQPGDRQQRYDRGLAQRPRRRAAAEIDHDDGDARDRGQHGKGAGHGEERRDQRVHDDRDVRRAGVRVNGGQPAREEAISAEREQDARGPQRVTGEIAEHRDAADGEQEGATALPSLRQGVRQRRL